MQSLEGFAPLRSWSPILLFHEVLPDGLSPMPPTAVTVSTLRAILQDFTARGYRAGTLADALQPPGNPVKRLVLTFDDGTADFLDYALPVLQEFQCTATLFVVAGLVGGRRTWRDPASTGAAPPPVPLLDAAGLRDLAAAGFTIGSHSLTHRPLPSLSMTDAAAEVATSRYVLSDLLGQPVDWFAYPYAAAGPATEALVWGAGYSGAGGGYHADHHRYYLTRIEAARFSPAQLRLRTSGLFQWTRRTARRSAHRPLPRL
jgi:peptidoglycan/xylan/chitin deacetylase (PgdA/CDA1 family)